MGAIKNLVSSQSLCKRDCVRLNFSRKGQIVFIESYKDRAGGLTDNATTPYVLPFIDLADGLFVAVLPDIEKR
jgi:hypothetical protein